MSKTVNWTTKPTIINKFLKDYTYMFIDESGNGSINNMRDSFKNNNSDPNSLRNEIYLLNGVIINGAEYTKLNRKFLNVKKGITLNGNFDYTRTHKNYGIRPINLHNREIEGKEPPFNNLNSAFYTKLNNSIENSCFTQITSGLNYMNYINNKTFGENMNPLLLCLNELIVKYAEYLNEKGIKGAIVFESDNKKIDKLKLQYILKLKEKGNENKKSIYFKNIVAVYFRPKCILTKKGNFVTCAGLELADLTISPVRKCFSLEFIAIEKHLYGYPIKAINVIK